MTPSSIGESLLALHHGLSALPYDFAYLGGCALAVLVTDPSADTIRVTKDIDVMMDIRSRKQFHEADSLLEKSGFRHDTRDGAPICRWVYNGITVDVLPISEDVLGWKSRWFEEALATAHEVNIAGQMIKVVSPPYFIALKLEAFEERGQGDFLTSTDFEDVVCLFNGRETLVDEIIACETLCETLAEKFRRYLRAPDLYDAVEGFAQTESEPDVRRRHIIGAFQIIASH